MVGWQGIELKGEWSNKEHLINMPNFMYILPQPKRKIIPNNLIMNKI